MLYVHQDARITGSAISLRNLLTRLDRRRFEPRVLLPAEGELKRWLEDSGVAVDVLAMGPFWTFPSPQVHMREYWQNWAALAPARAMRAYLRRLKPDLVHLNDKAVLAAGIAAAKEGLPIVWHLRSPYLRRGSRLQPKVSRHLINRHADALIAISADECDGFSEADQRLRIVWNSIDPSLVEAACARRGAAREELGIGPDEIAIGMIGSVTEMEGAPEFVTIAGKLARRFPNTRLRFVIVGRTPESSPAGWRRWIRSTPWSHVDASRMAREMEIGDALLMTGYRPDGLGTAAAFDIGIVCNRYCALGRPPFEMMSLGCPVVVTDGRSGRSGLVLDGETGYVARSGDLDAVADGVGRLIADPELRARLGRQAREFARQWFDPQRSADLVQAVYDDVLASRP